jgi:hypothetical protein
MAVEMHIDEEFKSYGFVELPRKRGGERKILQRTARRCDAQGYMTILFTSSVLRSYWLANLVAVLVYSLPLSGNVAGAAISSAESPKLA